MGFFGDGWVLDCECQANADARCQYRRGILVLYIARKPILELVRQVTHSEYPASRCASGLFMSTHVLGRCSPRSWCGERMVTTIAPPRCSMPDGPVSSAVVNVMNSFRE